MARSSMRGAVVLAFAALLASATAHAEVQDPGAARRGARAAATEGTLRRVDGGRTARKARERGRDPDATAAKAGRRKLSRVRPGASKPAPRGELRRSGPKRARRAPSYFHRLRVALAAR